MSADQITVSKHTAYRVKDAINDVADEKYEKNYTLIADYAPRRVAQVEPWEQ